MADGHVMTDDIEELARRLVIGRKRDGRCIYDQTAKAELVALSQSGQVSMAKLARHVGVNANQLSSWVRLHERAQTSTAPSSRSQPLVHHSADASPASQYNPSCAFVAVDIPMHSGPSLPIHGDSSRPVATPSPSISSTASPTALYALRAGLPNGVCVELGQLDRPQLCEALDILGRLACSASTKA
jgi:transposase